ncbi:hypothetical protein AB3Z07_26720 (plasmid) [Metabacillus halosaccharovorans]|uniref:hypothetical protein n=1 Tax=Metabacillus halosaccharovorans TaxID=930124 RepID=UPI001C1FD939|nr:hypothetical protein [Metabacillus halosaccharovorans]MBU7595678.1 hypothetical protein [Metabacillus halosaccharovorans]MCM3441554.1 hypothetical protein [Metabacillus halosaccharovorans]
MEQHHHQHQDMQHHRVHMGTIKNEIQITLTYHDPILRIHLEDVEGNAPELLLTHEKYMHVIVVSNDLQEFYHVHPEQKDKYTYEVNLPLISKLYKVFIDISPNDKQYLIEPNSLDLNKSSHTHFDNDNLKVNTGDKKVINGKTVELTHDPFEVGQDVMLRFDFKGIISPDPYLGALGHVVIIDEKLEKFIHVHPISDHETVFVAHFEEKGIYKLWGEFKFGEEVIAFPWVIEVI